MVDVKGRWAFVTGAARGIGRGAALFLAERGFGRIVNTTSGIRLEPEQAGYSASKAAQHKQKGTVTSA